ncbi:hypothetical protein PIB30_068715 [Stylosanthes scabra]|uniref:SWIM-type domain-containing protein n=1 Tax=Stylosanthes scabra TaxID=79078 RepID=A0ABU6VQF0_9FABA|nr:hypothetical protein [Stylosanthes scabra]
MRPSTKWLAEWAGDTPRMRFQVKRGIRIGEEETLDVNLIKHTCSCNKWQLTGMPCVHAIAAIRQCRGQVSNIGATQIT